MIATFTSTPVAKVMTTAVAVRMEAVVMVWLMRKISDMTERDATPKRRSRYS